MSEYGITESGFNRKPYEVLREEMLEKARDIFGPDWNLGRRSVVGLIIRATAYAMANAWMLAEMVYNSRFVRYAFGVSLDRLAEQINITRNIATRADGIVTFTGEPGVEIPDQTELTNADDASFPVFITRESAIIQDRGEVDVWVDAEEAGRDGMVAGGTINNIVDPIAQVDAVNNNFLSDDLVIGNEINSTVFYEVGIGQSATQSFEVEDVIHDINVVRVDVLVRNPESFVQFYNLGFGLFDENFEVIANLPTQLINIGGVSTQRIELSTEVDLRNYDTVTLGMINGINSDDEIQLVVDETDNYPQGELEIEGTPIPNQQWVVSVISETTGATRGGTDTEEDFEFRNRYFDALAVRGSGTVASIRANVLNVSGVRSVIVDENPTDQIVGDLPPHSFETVVLGGNQLEIAETILDHAPAGITIFGQITLEIEDGQGNIKPISFTRPDEISIVVNVEIETDGRYGAEGQNNVINSIVEYIGGIDMDNVLRDGLSVGQDVVYAKVFRQVMVVDGVTDAPVVEIAIEGEPLDTQNITMEPREIAQITVGNINIAEL